ncbi:Dynactin, partial [Operophtera brumata]
MCYQPSDRTQELGQLHESISTSSSALQQQLKGIRHRLPPGALLSAVPLDPQELGQLHESISTSGSALQQQLKSIRRRLPPGALLSADDHGPVRTIKHALSAVSGDVTKLAAFAHDNDGAESPAGEEAVGGDQEPQHPSGEQLSRQQAKQEELSEMQIRRELGERKLATAARDSELRAEQLHRKLEDALNQLKRKEKEFEETMDHLQQDIDSLENERGALRDKLKLYAKRGGSHHEETPVKIAPGVAAGEVNEALQQQLKVLSWTLERERGARVAACRRAELATIRSLRPLERPTGASAVARRQAHAMLEKRTLELQTAEARRQLLIHRPWRCVDADFAQFPVPELSA